MHEILKILTIYKNNNVHDEILKSKDKHDETYRNIYIA